MRYSEAICKLEKDPTLEFKLVERHKTWTLRTDYDPRFPDDSLYFILDCESEEYHASALGFNGNLLVNDEGWELVGQPVAWQEAMQEFAKGKKLIIKFHNQEWTLDVLVELPNYLDIAITKGEWYVED